MALSSLAVCERVALVAGQARADGSAVGLPALRVAAAGVRVAGIGHTCGRGARQALQSGARQALVRRP